MKAEQKGTYMFGNLMTEKSENFPAFSGSFKAMEAEEAKNTKKIVYCIVAARLKTI